MFAFITVLLWSLSYVFTRLALRYYSSRSLGFLRFGIASIFLIAGLIATKQKLPKPKDWGWFLGKGILSYFVYMMAFNKGSKTVTAATVSVIIATGPVLTALLVRVFYREKLKLIQYAAMGIEFAGVFIVTALKADISVNTGVLWLLFACTAGSVSTLFLRKILETYDAFPATAYSILIGTVCMGIAAPNALNELRAAPANQIFILLVLAIFPSLIGYVTWSMAFKRSKTTTAVANYNFVPPFTTALLGFLIAGEKPEFSTVIGGLVILVGMFVFTYGDRILNRRAPQT